MKLYEHKYSGIYMIKNKINGKVYIGSAINLYQRLRMHRFDLNNRRHHSIHLQRAWDKYGENNFEFIILECVLNNNILIDREQYWINKFKSYDRNYGYNIVPKAGSSLGYTHTKESLRKMRTTSEEQDSMIEKLLIEGKLNNKEIAKIVNVNVGIVSHRKRELIRKGIIKGKNIKERNEKIKDMLLRGFTVAKVARIFGLAPSNVSYIKSKFIKNGIKFPS